MWRARQSILNSKDCRRYSRRIHGFRPCIADCECFQKTCDFRFLYLLFVSFKLCGPDVSLVKAIRFDWINLS